MPNIEIDLPRILVYFVYGLAFFSMGIGLILETGRSPRLVERRVLRPLALFGLLHGSHEWLEIFLLQAEGLGSSIPNWFAWFRVGWLALSFTPLMLFGFLGLNRNRVLKYFEIYFVGLLILFCLFLAAVSLFTNLAAGDALSRYFLAIPGAGLAALALISRSRSLTQEGLIQISRCFFGAGLGFGLYSISQVFVPAAEFFPANLINSAFFFNAIGIPVQVVRAGAAVLITVNLIRAIQLAEQERAGQLLAAQQEQLNAMERVQQELVNREAMRRDLLRHIVIAQEDERARIARELHDETAQVLTAFSLELATLRTLAMKRKTEKDIIERLLNLSRQMSQSLYRLVHDLRPAQLDDLGLVPALQHLVEEARWNKSLEVTLTIEGTRQRLDPLIETVIFRIAQEALTNIKRHAQTSKACMHLVYDPSQVALQIRDNGVGFDTYQELRPPHGWGLAGMRERAEAVRGTLFLHSAPQEGTLVEVSIPLAQP